MKKWIGCIVLCLLCSVVAFADETDEIVKEQLDAISMEGVDQQLAEAKGRVLFGDFQASEAIRRYALGEFQPDVQGTVTSILEFFFQKLYTSLEIVLQILTIALFSALLENICHSLGNKQVGNLSKLVALSLVAVLGIQLFLQVAGSVRETVDHLSLFMNEILSVLLALLAAGGAVVTAGALHPLLVTSAGMVTMLVKTVLFPFVSLIAALKLVNCLSEELSVRGLAEFFEKAVKWLIGISMTGFVGLVSVLGAAAPAFDEITVRTTKYAVGNFIPYVGGLLSDSVELVLQCSLLVKNAAGIVGLIGICMVAAVPCLEAWAQIIVLSFAAAMVEPVCSKSVTAALRAMISCLNMLLGMLVVVSVMFFICITAILMMGRV